MLKTYIYFLISILTFIFVTSFSSKNTKEDMIMLEYVINQNKEVNDSVLLKNNFEKLNSTSNSYLRKNLDVIYYIYLADIYSKQFDKVNSKSNQLYAKANKIVKELGNPGLQIWLHTKFGFYYYNYSEYQKAFPHFMYASRVLDTTDHSEIIQKSNVYKLNAFFFGNVGNVEKSKDYLKLALDYTNNYDKEYGNILNALGALYYESKNYNNAKHYYELAKISAQKNHDQIRYAKILGDLALIYCHNKDFEKAIAYLKTDIDISEKENDERNVMFANIRLGKIYLNQNNITEAKKTIKLAEEYASTKDYLKSFELEINSTLLEIALKENDTQEELKLRRKLSDIESHLEKTDGKAIIDKINWDIQKKNFDYKFEAEQEKVERSKLLKNALIVIISLLILAIFLVFLALKRKMKIKNSDYENKVLLLQIEKLKSENKLNHTTKTLEDYKTYLSEKNQQIDTLNKEITKIQSSNSHDIETKKAELNKLLSSHLMTEENWNNFKELFIKEQAEYYNFLTINFPNLTNSNLRIIFLQKLGLNNTEIAHLLGITLDAVKKAKQRLKKKYDNYDTLFQENSVDD